jgi:hypothetical protein
VPVGSFNFSYGDEYEITAANTQGTSAYLTINSPVVQQVGGYHSLAELSDRSGDLQQIVEVGWIKNYNDSGPSLFVYHWVNGATSCYNGCGFVQYSGTTLAGMPLPADGGERGFWILHFEGNWWILYNNDWFGYFPDSLWNNAFTQVGRADWFGEVSMPGTINQPCAQMGDGQWGSSFNGANFSSTLDFQDYSTYSGATLTGFQSDPSFYNVAPFSATMFYFGGPGATCP